MIKDTNENIIGRSEIDLANLRNPINYTYASKIFNTNTVGSFTLTNWVVWQLFESVIVHKYVPALTDCNCWPTWLLSQLYEYGDVPPCAIIDPPPFDWP